MGAVRHRPKACKVIEEATRHLNTKTDKRRYETSVIEMRDLLSVLTVDEVEKRFRKVPGVASATVNFATGSATVRYDETLLEVADIKVLVHQRGQQSPRRIASQRCERRKTRT